MKMYKVMLVDDDRVARAVCANMPSWRKAGFSISYEADSGVSALEILRTKNDVDLVFTDIRMSRMDGIDLLKRIRKEGINVFVVLMSLYREFEYAREGLKYGAVDYIMKPISESALDETLESVRICLNESKNNETVRNIVTACFVEVDANMKDPFIINLCDLLTEKLAETPSMDNFADEMGFSKDYFGKMVKHKTGLSFSKLFTRMKMLYAKELILSGKYKFYEISDVLGYANPDYFTRVFKNEFGCSPAEFKKVSE